MEDVRCYKHSSPASGSINGASKNIAHQAGTIAAMLATTGIDRRSIALLDQGLRIKQTNN